MVTVTVTSTDTGAVQLRNFTAGGSFGNSASAIFISNNWSGSFTIVVQGSQDADSDNESLNLTFSATQTVASGPYTSGTAPSNLPVTVTDDDTPSGVSLMSGGADVGVLASDAWYDRRKSDAFEVAMSASGIATRSH